MIFHDAYSQLIFCMVRTLQNINLIEVGPLYMLLHSGSDNSPLLIIFSASEMDLSNRDYYLTTWYFGGVNVWIWVDYTPEVTRNRNNKNDFYHLQNTAIHLKTLSYWSLSWGNMQIQSKYKVHINTNSNRKLSYHFCDSENRGLTLDRLLNHLICWMTHVIRSVINTD